MDLRQNAWDINHDQQMIHRHKNITSAFIIYLFKIYILTLRLIGVTNFMTATIKCFNYCMYLCCKWYGTEKESQLWWVHCHKLLNVIYNFPLIIYFTSPISTFRLYGLLRMANIKTLLVKPCRDLLSCCLKETQMS